MKGNSLLSLGLFFLPTLSYGFLPSLSGRQALSFRHRTSSISATRSSPLQMKQALVVQNKGGGHGELGYHIASILADNGHTVTILNDKTDTTKQPFCFYPRLEVKGVEIDYCDLSDPAAITEALNGKEFSYVFDNYAKDESTAKTVAELARKSWPTEHYVYVSSGGIYKDTPDGSALTEDLPVKDSKGQRQVELYLDSVGLPYTCFRPQYIYGPYTNKRDYLDYFFDRVEHNRPVPVPGDGEQLVTVSNAIDIARMLTSVIGNAGAVKEIFNCATTDYISYSGIVDLVAKTISKKKETEVQGMVVNYPQEEHDNMPKKNGFPFRKNAFYVSSAKAASVLGFSPTHTLEKDLEDYYKYYVEGGFDKKALEKEYPVDEMLK